MLSHPPENFSQKSPHKKLFLSQKKDHLPKKEKRKKNSRKILGKMVYSIRQWNGTI